MSETWIERRSPQSKSQYVELVMPTEPEKKRARARKAKTGRVLRVLGIVATVLGLAPILVLGAVLNDYVPFVVFLVIAAVLWVAAVFLWRAYVERFASRPQEIIHSASEYEARRAAARARQAASAPRRRIEGDLEFYE